MHISLLGALSQTPRAPGPCWGTSVVLLEDWQTYLQLLSCYLVNGVDTVVGHLILAYHWTCSDSALASYVEIFICFVSTSSEWMYLTELLNEPLCIVFFTNLFHKWSVCAQPLWDAHVLVILSLSIFTAQVKQITQFSVLIGQLSRFP